MGFESKSKFLAGFGWYFALGSGSMDPGSQNVADPTDPNPGFTDKRSNDVGSNDKGSNNKGSKVRQRVKRQKVKMIKIFFDLNHRKLATLLSIFYMDLIC